MLAQYNRRLWKVLCWNVRGLNSDKKWTLIKDKITESQCDILCLQETKKELLDSVFIKKFCPSSFDKFEFLPSQGASGGLVTIWKSAMFEGHMVFSNEYAISIKFTSYLDDCEWILTNVYGPCTTEQKRNFVHWLKHIQMPDDID